MRTQPPVPSSPHDGSSAPDADAALVAQGERFVEIAATFLVAAALAVGALTLVRLGADRLPQLLVRFAFTLGLAWALLRGRAWARWCTVLLCGAAYVLFLPAVAGDLFRTVATLPSLLVLALLVGYAIVARGLLYSTGVRAFFRVRGAARRARRAGTVAS